MLLHLRMFSTTEIGDRRRELLDERLIEHGVLRCNRRAPVSARRPFREGDRRLRALPSQFDPRIHFALNCGARSCPPIRRYSADSVLADLELATAAYLEAETTVEPNGRVTLPGLMKLYLADFGGRDGALAFAAERVEELAEPDRRG